MENEKSIGNVQKIGEFGQAVRLDFIDRDLLTSGRLEEMIKKYGITGITSNPTIFEKAITGSNDYHQDIELLVHQGHSAEEIYQTLVIGDIRRAASLFHSLYEENDDNGYVSLEVSPHLAYDTKGTIQEALTLWEFVSRDNMMIKIPATKEGLPAIRDAIGGGLNVNVTLLFGLERYEEVVEAYIAGLEDRVAAGKPIDSIASVASFFISRIDSVVDPLLQEHELDQYQGMVAVASAKQAYQIFKRLFMSDRFQKLQQKGAKVQRLLWASTSSKNPAYSPVKYVDELIGNETVNTIPMKTLEDYEIFGNPEARLENDTGVARELFVQLENRGIDMAAITQKLEDDGVILFQQSYDKLIAAIDAQKRGIENPSSI